MDPRPSDLDPYPRFGRDLGAVELWDQSLERSQQRRRLERASRSHRQRRKGTSLAVGAAMLAAPVVPAFASSSGRGSSSPRPNGGLDTSSVAAATGGRTQLLRFGDVGPAVTAVQARVGTAPDGIFGPLTRAAVERFQRSHGLPVSGIVDARTWAAVFNARVLFYDDSNEAPSTAAAARRASAERASVRLVLNRDPGGEESPSSGSGSAPQPEQAASSPAPTSPPKPSSTPAPTASSTPAPGGCTSGRIVTPVSGATLTGSYGESRPGHTHAGDDLAVASGTPIRAAQCGTVAQAGSEQGYGLMVCVRHAGGVTTCYAHMSRIAASVNQQVAAGQVIGYVGCTGSCTGPHVHFEVRRNGRAEDPGPYLAGTETIAGTTSTARATSVTRASTSRTTTVSAGRSSGSTTQSVVRVAAKTTGGATASTPAVTQAAAPAPAPPAQAAPAPAAPSTPSPQQSAPAPQPAPAQQPTPAPAPEQPAPAPQPAPAEQPTPTSAPEQSAPAPQPTPAPEQSAPAPEPAPAEQPTPAPERSTPASQPAPAEQSAPAPQPTPAPEQSAPAPEPAPAEQPTPAPEQSVPASQPAPAEQPAPAPEQSTPAPQPAPTAEQSTPAPAAEQPTPAPAEQPAAAPEQPAAAPTTAPA